MMWTRCMECGCRIEEPMDDCPYCEAPLVEGALVEMTASEFLGPQALASVDGQKVPLKAEGEVIGEATLHVVDGHVEFTAGLLRGRVL